MTRLALIKAAQRTGGSGGAEHRSEAVRRMAVFAKLIGIERHVDAGADVVTERHGAQQRRPAGAFALAHGECGRHNRTTGVAERRCVRIIGLIGVTQHAVGERRSGGGGDDAAAGDYGLCFAAQRFGIRDGFAARQQARTGHHRRQGVEHMVFGFFQHFGRQRFARGGRDIGADLLHDRGDFGFRFALHGVCP